MKKTLLFNFKVIVCFCVVLLGANAIAVQAVDAGLNTALYQQQETGTITG